MNRDGEILFRRIVVVDVPLGLVHDPSI
jgi:hypothetical protein